MDLFNPSSPGSLPTLSLTTNSSWLVVTLGEGSHVSHQPSDASTTYSSLAGWSNNVLVYSHVDLFQT